MNMLSVLICVSSVLNMVTELNIVTMTVGVKTAVKMGTRKKNANRSPNVITVMETI